MTALADRRRRWLLPAVAAAAIVLVVGAAVAVAGRDNSVTPAGPTPTGPEVAPSRPAATIPGTSSGSTDGTVGSPPVDIGAGHPVPNVWAAADYSRVLVARTTATPDAARPPDEWPIVEAVAGPAERCGLGLPGR